MPVLSFRCRFGRRLRFATSLPGAQVNKGFYNGMEIQRADGFVVQTGDPEGPAEGFVDPKTNEIRR